MLKNNRQKKFLGQRTGFTVIELLVVFFIIISLSVLLLAHYRNAQREYALRQATQRLVSDIRKAQNMAMGGVDISEISERKGYGVYARAKEDENSFYIIYADKTGSCNYQKGPDELIENINLPAKVKIKEISSTDKKLDVLFYPPDPVIYLNVPASPPQVTVTLGVEGTPLEKTVIVTSAGLVWAMD